MGRSESIVPALLDVVNGQVGRVLDALGIKWDVKGNRIAIVCPFHPDRNPSLFFRQDGVWHCFGCGEGGGIIDFVEKYLSLSRKEAIKWLCDLFDIEDTGGGFSNPETSAFRRLLRQAEDALVKSKKAKEYLRGRLRGRIPRVKVGYLDASIRFDEFSEDERKALERLGILRGSALNPLWEERVIFPLTSNGRILGFAGRAIGDKELRWVFTKGTKKSEVLFYGEQGAKVVIVEGIFDALSVRGGVAILGATISDAQANEIAKMGKEVVIATDVDSAGKEARVQITKALIKRGVLPLVALWDKSEGKDLNEVLQKAGEERVKKIIEGAEFTIFKVLSDAWKKSKSTKKRLEIAKRMGELFEVLPEELFPVVKREIDEELLRAIEGRKREGRKREERKREERKREGRVKAGVSKEGHKREEREDENREGAKAKVSLDELLSLVRDEEKRRTIRTLLDGIDISQVEPAPFERKIAWFLKYGTQEQIERALALLGEDAQSDYIEALKAINVPQKANFEWNEALHDWALWIMAEDFAKRAISNLEETDLTEREKFVLNEFSISESDFFQLVLHSIALNLVRQNAHFFA